MKNIIFLIIPVLLFVVGCSKNNDEKYFELAQKSMDAKEYTTALMNFQKIVDEYPNSEHYRFALLKTGELNQGYVDQNLSKKESLLKAIDVYTKFHEKYPEDSKAPQTLFMIGFIQANELMNIEEARKAYSKFLELYPNSEMAQSAQAEIDNLGLSPDEILQKKMRTDK